MVIRCFFSYIEDQPTIPIHLKNYIRTLSPVSVYANHSVNASILKTTVKDEYIPYKRIKLREGIRWFEVILPDNKLGYVKKDKDAVFKCKYAELEDDEAYGFNYILKTDEDLSFYDLFKPYDVSKKGETTEDTEPVNAHLKIVEVKRVKDKEKNKFEYIQLQYDSSIVEVNPVVLKKKQVLHITYEPEVLSKEPFIEVSNFKEKHGYFLKKSSFGLMKDKWMTYLSYIIIILTTIATFLICLASGWLVIGLILLIPGIIAGFLIMLGLQIVISILRGVFHEIYIRL